MFTRSLSAATVAFVLMSPLPAPADDSKFDVAVREKKGEQLEVVTLGDRGIGKAMGLEPGDNIVWFRYQYYEDGKLKDGNMNSPKKLSDVEEFMQGKKGVYFLEVWRESEKKTIPIRGIVTDSPFNQRGRYAAGDTKSEGTYLAAATDTKGGDLVFVPHAGLSAFEVLLREKKGEQLEVVGVGEQGIAKAMGLKRGDNIVYYRYQRDDDDKGATEKKGPTKPSDVEEFMQGKKGVFTLEVWRDSDKKSITIRGTVSDNKDAKSLVFKPR